MTPEEVVDKFRDQLSSATIEEMVDALYTVRLFGENNCTPKMRRQLYRSIVIQLSMRVLKDGFV